MMPTVKTLNQISTVSEAIPKYIKRPVQAREIRKVAGKKLE
jgi:hypothetical protein